MTIDLFSKVCSKCGFEKPYSEFSKDRRKKTGLCSACKACVSIYAKKHYKENQEYYKERYKSLDKEQRNKYHRERRNKNIEEARAYQRNYCKNNKEKYREYNKKYLSSPEKREKYNKRMSKWITEKSRKNIGFKLTRNVKNNLSYHLLYKKDKTQDYLTSFGYTIFDLKVHLESKFVDDMSWDNYGRINGVRCWEIDHIIPQSHFNLEDKEELNRCWSLENLQPLWAFDNRSKGAKILCQ